MGKTLSVMNRRAFIRTGATGLLGVWGSTFLPGKAFCAEKKETVRIGYLPITDAAPLLIAHAMGYFKDEGLEVEKPVLIRNWSALVESFLTGKFNVTHLLLPIPVWMRFNNKAPVKVMAWNHINGSAVTVHEESGIHGFADFEGKQIAVPYWYSMHNVILQMGLRKAGLTPVVRDQDAPLKPKEVNLFILPPPDMPAALLGRKIDGYIVAEPFNALGELKFGAKILRFTGDMWKNHPCCVVVMNENLVRSRPVFTQKVIHALVRAQLWTSKNLSEAAWILGRNGGKYLPVTEDVLQRVFSGYALSTYGPGTVPQAIQHTDWKVGRIGFQPFPYPSATRLIVQEMGKTRMQGHAAFLEKLDPGLAAAQLVDDSFVKKAIENAGGLKQFVSLDFETSQEAPWDREEVVSL